MKPIQWIRVRSELGAGTRGASLGIDALKIAAINAGDLDFFSRFEGIEVADENHLLHMQADLNYAKRIAGIHTMYERISQTILRSLHTGHFPVVMSGDHSSAGATIAGTKMAYPDKRIGVVWIDAHADLHSPYTSPSGNVHGMPLTLSLNEDNLDCRHNEIHPSTREYWNKLKAIGGISPKIHYNDLVYIALRDTEAEEDYLINKHNVRVFPVEEVTDNGVTKVVADTLDHLSNCDFIYISFDVDSMDAGLARGTGTPVANGLSNNQARRLLNGLLASQKVCCLELAEINPLLDLENQIARLTFPILKSAVETIVGEEREMIE